MEERKMRPRPRRSRRKVCKFCVEKATGSPVSAPSISAIWLSPSSAPA